MRLRNKVAVITGAGSGIGRKSLMEFFIWLPMSLPMLQEQSCPSMEATPCNEEKGWNRNKNLRVTNVEKEEGKEPKIKSKEVMQLRKRMVIKYQKEEIKNDA